MEFTARGTGHELIVGVDDYLEWRHGAASTPEDLEFRAAQHRGGQRNRRPSALANLYQAHSRARRGEVRARQGGEQSFRRTPPQEIDHYVEARVTGLAGEGFGEVLPRLVKADGCISAKPAERAEHLLASTGGHDASGAQPFGNLYRELAGYSGRAENENALAVAELSAPGERKPCRHAGIQQCGRGYIIDARRHRKTPGSRHGSAFRHRAVGTPRPGEHYP